MGHVRLCRLCDGPVVPRAAPPALGLGRRLDFFQNGSLAILQVFANSTVAATAFGFTVAAAVTAALRFTGSELAGRAWGDRRSSRRQQQRQQLQRHALGSREVEQLAVEQSSGSSSSSEVTHHEAPPSYRSTAAFSKPNAANMLRNPCTLIPAPSSPPSEEFNTSFMLLKPHANTAEAQKLVRQELLKRELKLLKEGEITAEEIHQRRIIDVHYGSMAAKALDISPPDLVVQPKGQKAFEDCFGLAWKLALEKDLVCNASEAMERLGFSSQELDRRWTPLQIGTDKVKFGGGFYCGYIEGLYVINGFYCSMRSQYTETGTSVHWYEVQWPVKTMSWASFRSEVLGDTDPARASQSSLRGIMHGCWEELGLQRKPHVGENAVHASASPFEALLERENWLGVEGSKDHFGEMLLEAGISRDVITSWSSDPTVEHDGRSQSLFDLLENMDSERCLETAKKLVSSGWKKTTHE